MSQDKAQRMVMGLRDLIPRKMSLLERGILGHQARVDRDKDMRAIMEKVR